MTHSASALAHLLDLPASEPWGGLVILHGAGSRKENHADMAAAATAAGLARVEPELGLGVPGQDRRVRVGVDARPDPQQHALAPACGHTPFDPQALVTGDL